MKSSIGLILFSLLVNFSFGQDITTNNQIKTKNDNWLEACNNKSEQMASFYYDDAIQIMPNGSFVEGNENIAVTNLNKLPEMISISSDSIIKARDNRNIWYEMGTIETSNNESIQYIVIWRRAGGTVMRQFEYFEKTSLEKTTLEQIDHRRNEWITLCNQNDSKRLIDNLYSSQTIYYNHKPLVIGREALTKEYAYMNREQYQLTLHPIIVRAVNQKTVFEIGQCKGSYGGKYIIIWRKNEKGQWKIFLDSNL